MVKAGMYGAQAITGDKPRPGCVVQAEPRTTIGDLVTGARYLTLVDVTVNVGDAKHSGWKATASNVTLRAVRLRGAFVRVDIYRVDDVRWLGGELGSPGTMGGKRVCGLDALPVQVGEARGVTIDGVTFHPQDADSTPSACSPNGFHLEMIRLDGGTTFFALRNSTFVSGDRSGTATVFVTEPGSDFEPRDLVFENNMFGTNDSSVGAFNVHSNVSQCVNYTFAYNTFLAAPGLFQCTTAVNVRWIGNLGGSGPSAPMDCFGESTRNVWQGRPFAACGGGDRWVAGERDRSDRLGLGGHDGFRLRGGSPAIDAGEESGYCVETLGARDHDGKRRHVGRRCDAGADEYRDLPAVVGSLGRVRWVARSAERRIAFTLHTGEPVSVRTRLTQQGRRLAGIEYALPRSGRHRLSLPVRPAAVAGSARLTIVMTDVARNRLVVEREVRIAR